MTVRILELDALVRSIEVNKGSPHALFLGAGASLTSGVASASNCVLQWKRNIFESNNPELKAAVAEISLPAVQKRVDDWLKANQVWPGPQEDDYGFFIERCLPIVDDRRRFFQRLLKESKPHVGYLLLVLLAEEGIARSVWTTNFDGLVARSLLSNSSITPIEVGIDCQSRIARQPNTDELLCVSLHGDYRYDKLKNTEPELQEQEGELAKSLIDTLLQQSLIISGYSGRDRSIMEAMESAVVNPKAKGNVFWCGFSEQPEARVAELLGRANQVGREAFYVPGVSFDELLIRLARQCLTGERIKKAELIIGSATSTSTPLISPFILKIQSANALIKGNVFALTAPSEVYSFAIKQWPESGAWSWLRGLAKDNGFHAVPLNGSVMALATIDQIKKVFGDAIDGSIDRTPINSDDFSIANGSIHNLIRDSLVQAIATSRCLSTNGKDRLWESSPLERKSVDGVVYALHRSAIVDLRLIDSRLHISIDPTFFIPELEVRKDDTNFKELVKKKLGYQHNREYNEDLMKWIDHVAGESKNRSVIEFDFPPQTAAFSFKLNLLPSFAEIDEGTSAKIVIDDKHRPVIKFAGRVFPEPTLHFATEIGWNPKSDTLPLRGLANHGPFDTSSVKLLPQPDIKLSVICPKPEARMLSEFLSSSENKVSVAQNSQGEYVVDFKGFADTFGCRLIVPGESDDHWITIPEISGDSDVVAGCREWTRNICDALTTVAAFGRSVVLIASPERWNRFRIADSDAESFNVHDDVKAFAVRKGIATQFFDQDTWSPYDRPRIWWWLSLALYTKAMRTPWVLQSLDPGSAFVGLGYSVDHRSLNNKKIVLGCSHIYNAEGQGLQFRLRNIQDSTIRRDRNPYLSFNEARQMGEMIRQLFWESHYRLPDRVVIHKLFPYTRDEIKGIKAGLSGIKSLELLEINHESSIRFLKSKYSNGKFDIDRYPVRRGTTVKISNNELLLWVHGATEGVRPGKTYFQGKRRIPGPVVIRRYAGTSDVATIVKEILGLSKMDWNSGDLYSQLPATIKSSQTIARIGRRLASVGHTSFDYRLFM